MLVRGKSEQTHLSSSFASLFLLSAGVPPLYTCSDDCCGRVKDSLRTERQTCGGRATVGCAYAEDAFDAAALTARRALAA